MPVIDLKQHTHDRVHLLARAWEVDESTAIDRLVKHFLDGERTGTPSPEVEDEVPIHAIYRGQRAEGVYNRKTRSITLTEGPVHDTFAAPSPAAAAFVQEVNPGVSGNRNGWGFWIVTKTGETLQSIR